RKPGKHPGLEAVADALVDRRDEFARDDAALDGIHELIPRTGWQRLQVDDGMAVLAPPARLLDELALDALDRLANSFTIRYLRPADRDLHTELASEPIDEDFQMQLAHAGDDRLPRLVVRLHVERRILLRQP